MKLTGDPKDGAQAPPSGVRLSDGLGVIWLRRGTRRRLIGPRRRIRDYLARFQATSSVAPDAVLGFANFSSSVVRVVIILFCSPSPMRFANVRTLSAETNVQAPTSSSWGDFCWATASPARRTAPR